MDLYSYIKSGHSVLYLVSYEESRSELNILKTVEKLNGGKKKKYGLKIWSSTEGFSVPGTKEKEPCEDPIAALMAIKNDPEGTIIILRDFHMFLANPKVTRLIRDIARDFKQQQKCLIMLSPVRKIPAELERDLTVIEFDLPKRDEIEFVIKTLYKTSGAEEKFGAMTPDEFERLSQACGGLTLVECENAIAKALVDFGIKDQKIPISKLVMREKAEVVKKTGVLEFLEGAETAEDIGGLEVLKEWMQLRSKAFTKKAREFGIKPSKGCMIAGPAGGGKTLSAKAMSNILGVPLIKFDISRVFGSLVGQTEGAIRATLQTLDSINNCVVLIDEVEKLLSGMSSNSGGDSGVSSRCLASLLSWLNDKTSNCFVVATLNNISSLPPEFTRKGRFDEIFYVGLPDESARRSILKIHVKKTGRKVSFTDESYDECIKNSRDFSGAELAEAVNVAMYMAFNADRELSVDDINKAIKLITPLAKSRASDLEAMMKWGEAFAVNASKKPVNEKKLSGNRLVEL